MFKIKRESTYLFEGRIGDYSIKDQETYQYLSELVVDLEDRVNKLYNGHINMSIVYASSNALVCMYEILGDNSYYRTIIDRNGDYEYSEDIEVPYISRNDELKILKDFIPTFADIVIVFTKEYDKSDGRGKVKEIQRRLISEFEWFLYRYYLS